MNVQVEDGSLPCLDHGRKGYGLGYATAWIVREGKRVSTTLHRKVHFLNTGEWPEVVRHTCDNPRCIRPEHLVSGTQRDNVADMHNRGRHVYGGDARRGECRGYGVKLSDDAVLDIRTNLVPRHPTLSGTAFANKYGVSIAQISRIVNGTRRQSA